MRLIINKVYNRVTHSYLAVLEVEQTGAEDPAIFCCYDRSIDTCPQESSSSSSESNVSGEQSPILPSDSSQELSSEPSSSGDSSPVQFPEMPSSSSSSELSQEDVAEVGSSSSAEEFQDSSSSSEAGEAPPFQIFPNRTLVSVASLTDLIVHPLSAPQGEIYRATTVAMLFRSKRHMKAVLSEIISEVRTNARLQRIDIQLTENVELVDAVYGLDINKDYYFLT